LYCLKELYKHDILKELLIANVHGVDGSQLSRAMLDDKYKWLIPCALFDLLTQLGFSVPMRPSSFVACAKCQVDNIEYIKTLLDVNNHCNWPSIYASKSEWRQWITNASVIMGFISWA